MDQKSEAKTNIDRMIATLEAILDALKWQREVMEAQIAYALDPSPRTTALLRKYLSPR
jgi:hypothetical protein